MKRLKLHFIFLRRHRLRGDLMQVLKILSKFYDVIHEDQFQIQGNTVARTNGMKFKTKIDVTRTLEEKFFPNRTVEQWNKLPSNAVNSVTINTFKTRLDRYFIVQFLLFEKTMTKNIY